MKIRHLLLQLSVFAILTFPAAAQSDKVPEGVKTFHDISYVTNGHAHQKLDLYIPEKADGPTPIVVWIHGGGWVDGDKAGCPPLNAGYINRGYAAASLNYRVSGDAIYPAQIEDCKAAIRWLRAHAKEYNLDPTRIGVWGASAGGHLVALLGATGGTREFDVGENLDQSSAVQAVSDFFGPTDVLQMDGHAVPGARLIHNEARSPESKLVGGPIQEEPFRRLAMQVNPILFLGKDTPPYLMVHGDQDPLVPHHQSELLFTALQKFTIPAHLHTIKGAGHGTGFGGKEIGEMVAAFFDYRLMGRKTAAADWPAAMTTESDAVAETARPSQPSANRAPQPSGDRPRLTWEEVARREGVAADGKIPRSAFKGPPQIFDRLDTNKDGVLTKEDFGAPSGPEKTAPAKPQASVAAPATTVPASALAWQSASVTVPDGTVIPLIWTEPERKGPFPVIVYVHGAPGGSGEAGLRGLGGQSRWAQFVKAGFAVCLTDYRSHPENDPFAVLRGEITAADDVAAAISHLGTLPSLDPKRVILFGQSLGGATALLGASNGKLKPAGLVVSAPASFLFIGIRGRPDRSARDLTEAEYDRAGTLERVARINCPVLIIQGTTDGLAPLNRALAAAFKDAGKDVRLELFEGQGHGFTNGPENESYQRAVGVTLDFARKNTGR